MERYIVITQAYKSMKFNNGQVVYAKNTVDEYGNNFNDYYKELYFVDNLRNALMAYYRSTEANCIEQFSYILVI